MLSISSQAPDSVLSPRDAVARAFMQNEVRRTAAHSDPGVGIGSEKMVVR